MSAAPGGAVGVGEGSAGDDASPTVRSPEAVPGDSPWATGAQWDVGSATGSGSDEVTAAPGRWAPLSGQPPQQPPPHQQPLLQPQPQRPVSGAGAAYDARWAVGADAGAQAQPGVCCTEVGRIALLARPAASAAASLAARFSAARLRGELD